MKNLIFFCIKIYQKFISPLLQPRCRYYPTCSEYARLCLIKKSFITAIFKIFYRIFKCNPFSRGGIDLP